MGRLKQKQIEFIKNNVGKLTNKEMATILKCHPDTITNWRRKLGISFDQLHDFSSYNKYIIDNYYKKTAKKLSEEIGCSKGYITKIWIENCPKNKTPRRYYADFSYFNSINTPNKAYILGFLYADGCIYKRDNHEGLWQITVEIQDIDILEKIKQEIKATNPIHVKEKTATLSVVSQQMFDDLVQLGIVPRKTYAGNLETVLNKLPKNLIKDFIHGFFDGDGSITVKDKPNESCLQFAVPERSYQDLQQALADLGIVSHWCQDTRYEKYTIPFGALEIHGASNKYCLLKLFQLENTISLNRKTQLSQQLCEQIQSNKTNRSENKIAVIKWEEMLESLRR